MLYNSIQSPLGRLLLVVDNKHAQVVAFCRDQQLHKDIAYWSKQLARELVQGHNQILEQLKLELEQYFAGRLQRFSVSYDLSAFTSFQRTVLTDVATIPYGGTKSYKQVACQVRSPRAYRAVGTANGANRLAIIIPCHRVVAHSGGLGGYAYGLDKKSWLLQHEQNNL